MSAAYILDDPVRLQTLRDLELLDTPAEASFDRLTRLAAKILEVPISLVTIVDRDRQFFKSAFGLEEPAATDRQGPLVKSYCKFVVQSGEPLVAGDAREHPLLHDNPAIAEDNSIAYLGVPLTTKEGVRLGTLCVVDHQPRQWDADDLDVMREFARSVMTEIELRQELKAREAAEQQLRSYAEALETRNLELDAFGHTVAHDLKNPLANVIMAANFINQQSDEVTPFAQKFLGQIEESAVRMDHIINQLLELATLRDANLNMNPVEMNAAAQNAIDRFRPDFERAEMTAEIEGDLPDALGHAAWVEEVFANLISNAIKYRRNRPDPWIVIRARSIDGLIRYEVADNGLGIPQEKQAFLFEMFSRAHEGVAPGFGIGLSIVHRMVTRMGGLVGVESVPGEGSTFWFSLPGG